jgi:predicted AlkP superfamily pyrophosphatase or phosphodiesterase
MTVKEGVPLIDIDGAPGSGRSSPSVPFPDEAGWESHFNERPALKKRAWARWKSWKEWKTIKNWKDCDNWFPFVNDLSVSKRTKNWIKMGLYLITGILASLVIYAFLSWIMGGLIRLIHGQPSSTGSMPGVWSTFNRTLILISLDGFRAEYLKRGLTPTLEGLSRQGVQAEHLIPCFPSITFPNHYSIVTGLYPGSHGVVGNTYFDSRLNETFSYNNVTQNGEAKWWEGGEPLWVTAEKQGKRSASLMWPGSEAPIQGIRPSIWKPYSTALTPNDRVDQALEWLNLPVESRPSFITLYFPTVDSVGHEKGVHSKELEEALMIIDDALDRLVEGLETRSILDKVNLMIVSDHGMTDTSPDRVIYLDDFIDMEQVRIVENGPLLMVYPQGKYVNGMQFLGAYVTLQNKI